LTFDALHAVKDTFEAVVEKQADFLVCVKGNASDLRHRVEKHLNRRQKTLLRAQTVDHAHGRIEKRAVEMAAILPSQTGWPHTHTACLITRERQQIRRGQTVGESREQVVYIGSFTADAYSPEHVLALVRGHWGIENGLHHRKDRSMDEDRCRSSASKTGRVMCCLRSIAAVVLGRAKESLSVVQRRLSRKTHLLLGLLSCASLSDWESRYKPYKLA
jgi:predicted transposase YbfD/YdcC